MLRWKGSVEEIGLLILKGETIPKKIIEMIDLIAWGELDPLQNGASERY